MKLIVHAGVLNTMGIVVLAALGEDAEIIIQTKSGMSAKLKGPSVRNSKGPLVDEHGEIQLIGFKNGEKSPMRNIMIKRIISS